MEPLPIGATRRFWSLSQAMPFGGPIEARKAQKLVAQPLSSSKNYITIKSYAFGTYISVHVPYIPYYQF